MKSKMKIRLGGRKSGETERSDEQSERLTVPMTSVMATETTKLSTCSENICLFDFTFKLIFS